LKLNREERTRMQIDDRMVDVAVGIAVTVGTSTDRSSRRRGTASVDGLRGLTSDWALAGRLRRPERDALVERVRCRCRRGAAGERAREPWSTAMGPATRMPFAVPSDASTKMMIAAEMR
jgi:hypothetical protein